MVEGGGGLRFLHEALPLVGTADSVGGKHLQGDEPVQTRVTGLVDDAHAALAEDFDDLVVQETLAGHGAPRL